MEIYKVYTGRLRTNTYIVAGKDGDCFVIDPGGNPERVEQILRQNVLSCKAVLLTHEHFDHCFCVANFQKKGAMVYAHENAVQNFADNIHQNGSHFKIAIDEFNVDVVLHDGDIFELCGLSVEVIHTPGHTSGSVCYRIDDVLFSGDTLFMSSIGRTDLATGSQSDIINSITNKLFSLPGDYRVLPGHGEETTLLFEKATNRYLS